MSEAITANYGRDTNVLCKACGERTIFVESPVTVTIENGKTFLTLKCPSPSCGQVRQYNEDELEIR